MNAFLKAAMQRAEVEHEQRLVARRGREISEIESDAREDGRGGAHTAGREEMLRERGRQALALRAQGLLWVHVAARLGLTSREARHAVRRIEFQSANNQHQQEQA